jgi:assimilatory nitrate reductase catalytic subunit
MDIDESWSSQIQVREELVTIDPIDRIYTSDVKNNARLLTQWHGMSRTDKSQTLNNMTKLNPNMQSIHHITNTELFKDKEVELDKYSKQPCFKG